MKQKRNIGPKQLANLKPIQKGQVLNPEGSRAHNPILKALKKLTREEFCKVIEVACLSDIAALQAITKNTEASALQVGVARAMMKSVNKGDWGVLESIVSRVVGKIPDQLEVKTNAQATITILDHAKIIEANKKLEDDF